MGTIEKNKIIAATHTANYKQVIEFGATPSDDLNLMSIDTGMGGNLFAGHYFTMNAAHLSGKLNKVSSDFEALRADSSNYELKIRPKIDRDGKKEEL